MSRALIENFTTTQQWQPLGDMAAFDAFINREGEHVIFIPGKPERNLESGDVAVILPEIARHFQHRFDVAIVADDIERAVREYFDVFTTPSLIFVRNGRFLGAIPKVRDWQDYITRTGQILNTCAQS